MTIMVNGRRLSFFGSQIAYAEVVLLAQMRGTPTVTFRNAPPPRIEGTLAPGQSVAIEDGTVFNVSHTGDA